MIPLLSNNELVGEARIRFFRRSQADIDSVMEKTKEWIHRIQKKRDSALLEYIRQFDDPQFSLENLRVSPVDIKRAYEALPSETLEVLQKQIALSRAFHGEQARRVFADRQWEMETTSGVRVGCKKVSMASVGLYVPAGSAPLPSTAQLLTIAAKCAEVPRIAVFFPPTGLHPEIIVAADIAGADEIYRVGGIAAIAAMAYGTESIASVDKIAGPGSPWVQAAKQCVFGEVGIDIIAGPSEGLLLADETANAKWLAADILARCEHGVDSCMPLVTSSHHLAESVQCELAQQLSKCGRKKIIEKAFQNGYNGILLVSSEEEMILFANEYGAEHLHICTEFPERIFQKITNAGSIFLGHLTSVPLGDYATGTNHTLPTGRAVRFSSPVGVETFVKTLQFQEVRNDGLLELAPIVEALADVEGLDAHKNAVLLRLTS